MAPKQELLKLEKQSDFVFHGSPDKLEYLEPRQAYTWKGEEKIEDGKPAVFASNFAEIAIFMALINKQNIKDTFRSGFGFSNNNLEFRLTRETFNKLNNLKGYVYVFNKEGFEFRNPVEYISYKIEKPIKIIEVTEKDLPKDIKMI